MRASRRQDPSVWRGPHSDLKWVRTAALIAVLLLIGFSPLRHLYNWRVAYNDPQQVAERETRRASPTQTTQTARVVEDAQCTQQWKGRAIGPSPVLINEEGACLWRIKGPAQCYRVRRAAWTTGVKEHTICDKGPGTFTETVKDVESIWTTDGKTVRVSILLMPDPEKQELWVSGSLRKFLYGR